MREPADLEVDVGPAKNASSPQEHKDTDVTIQLSGPGPFRQHPSDGWLGSYSVALVVGIMMVCFLGTAGVVTCVGGPKDSWAAAVSTFTGWRGWMQVQHFAEDLPSARHRNLLQTGFYVVSASSAPAAVPAACTAAAGQSPSWGNPAMSLAGKCTSYKSTMGESSYSSSSQVTWTICWGVNVTAKGANRRGKPVVRFAGRLNPWNMAGWYPVDPVLPGNATGGPQFNASTARPQNRPWWESKMTRAANSSAAGQGVAPAANSTSLNDKPVIGAADANSTDMPGSNDTNAASRRPFAGRAGRPAYAENGTHVAGWGGQPALLGRYANCTTFLAGKLKLLCGCEQMLEVTLDTPMAAADNNGTACSVPNLLVSDPAFCTF